MGLYRQEGSAFLDVLERAARSDLDDDAMFNWYLSGELPLKDRLMRRAENVASIATGIGAIGGSLMVDMRPVAAVVIEAPASLYAAADWTDSVDLADEPPPALAIEPSAGTLPTAAPEAKPSLWIVGDSLKRTTMQDPALQALYGRYFEVEEVIGIGGKPAVPFGQQAAQNSAGIVGAVDAELFALSTNDGFNKFRKGYEDVVRAQITIGAQPDGKPPVLFLEPTYSTAARIRAGDKNAVIKEVAAELRGEGHDVRVLDQAEADRINAALGTQFVGITEYARDHLKPNGLLGGDGIHPTGAGYADIDAYESDFMISSLRVTPAYGTSQLAGRSVVPTTTTAPPPATTIPTPSSDPASTAPSPEGSGQGIAQPEIFGDLEAAAQSLIKPDSGALAAGEISPAVPTPPPATELGTDTTAPPAPGPASPGGNLPLLGDDLAGMESLIKVDTSSAESGSDTTVAPPATTVPTTPPAAAAPEAPKAPTGAVTDPGHEAAIVNAIAGSFGGKGKIDVTALADFYAGDAAIQAPDPGYAFTPASPASGLGTYVFEAQTCRDETIGYYWQIAAEKTLAAAYDWLVATKYPQYADTRFSAGDAMAFNHHHHRPTIPANDNRSIGTGSPAGATDGPAFVMSSPRYDRQFTLDLYEIADRLQFRGKGMLEHIETSDGTIVKQAKNMGISAIKVAGHGEHNHFKWRVLTDPLPLRSQAAHAQPCGDDNQAPAYTWGETVSEAGGAAAAPAPAPTPTAPPETVAPAPTPTAPPASLESGELMFGEDLTQLYALIKIDSGALEVPAGPAAGDGDAAPGPAPGPAPASAEPFALPEATPSTAPAAPEQPKFAVPITGKGRETYVDPRTGETLNFLDGAQRLTQGDFPDVKYGNGNDPSCRVPAGGCGPVTYTEVYNSTKGLMTGQFITVAEAAKLFQDGGFAGNCNSNGEEAFPALLQAAGFTVIREEQDTAKWGRALHGEGEFAGKRAMVIYSQREGGPFGSTGNHITDLRAVTDDGAGFYENGSNDRDESTTLNPTGIPKIKEHLNYSFIAYVDGPAMQPSAAAAAPAPVQTAPAGPAATDLIFSGEDLTNLEALIRVDTGALELPPTPPAGSGPGIGDATPPAAAPPTTVAPPPAAAAPPAEAAPVGKLKIGLVGDSLLVGMKNSGKIDAKLGDNYEIVFDDAKGGRPDWYDGCRGTPDKECAKVDGDGLSVLQVHAEEVKGLDVLAYMLMENDPEDRWKHYPEVVKAYHDQGAADGKAPVIVVYPTYRRNSSKNARKIAFIEKSVADLRAQGVNIVYLDGLDDYVFNTIVPAGGEDGNIHLSGKGYDMLTSYLDEQLTALEPQFRQMLGQTAAAPAPAAPPEAAPASPPTTASPTVGGFDLGGLDLTQLESLIVIDTGGIKQPAAPATDGGTAPAPVPSTPDTPAAPPETAAPPPAAAAPPEAGSGPLGDDLTGLDGLIRPEPGQNGAETTTPPATEPPAATTPPATAPAAPAAPPPSAGPETNSGKLEPLAGVNNPEKIFRGLTQGVGGTSYSPISANGAIGVMSNMQDESGFDSTRAQNNWKGTCAEPPARLNPDKSDPSEGGTATKGFGLVQWTPKGRQDLLQQRADTYGVSWQNLELQVSHILWELSPEGPFAELGDMLRDPNISVDEASRLFVSIYERPKTIIEGENAAEGTKKRDKYHNTINSRRANAQRLAGIIAAGSFVEIDTACD